MSLSVNNKRTLSNSGYVINENFSAGKENVLENRAKFARKYFDREFMLSELELEHASSLENRMVKMPLFASLKQEGSPLLSSVCRCVVHTKGITKFKSGLIDEGFHVKYDHIAPYIYTKDRFLSEGFFKETYSAQQYNVNTGQAKEIVYQKTKVKKDDPEKERARLTLTESEVKIQMSLDHENIVKIFDYNLYRSESGDEKIGVYAEKCDIDLCCRLTSIQAPPLEKREKMRIALDVASALEYVHKTGFVHCDIKPNNIMLVYGEPIIRAKLTDFGLCVKTGHQSLMRIGKIDPPEAHDNSARTEQMDVYQFGLTMMELFSPGFDNDFDRAVGKLIFRCLSTQPENRPLMSEVLSELQRLSVQFQLQS